MAVDTKSRVAELTANEPVPSPGRPHRTEIGPWLGQAGLPFVLVVYLGLRGGGFDEIVRGEVGIAAWWIAGLGAAAALLPLARLSRAAWLAIGALAALALWSGLAAGWSESSELTVRELGRISVLLGIFVLAVSVQGPDGLRRAVGGIAAGVVVVASVALLSRLQPEWFEELETPSFIPGSRERLHFPLGYWNGLAAFVAIGLPLVLAVATTARHAAVRALALAAIPALALTAFFTLSRGGAVEAALALAALVALHPQRRELLGSIVLPGAGSAILIFAASRRTELADGLTEEPALSQGDEMLALTLAVCAGVAALRVVIAHAEWPRLPFRPPRRPGARGIAATGVVALALAIAAGAPGALDERWQEFKEPDVPASETARFDSSSGSGRYQWWQSALDATETEPLTGIGPGAFELWWAREGTIPGLIRDAHSLYLETLAELGVVGLLLLVAALAIPFAAGLAAFRRSAGDERALLAGALAACLAFAAAAAIEWVWELTVLPVCFLLLAAALLGRKAQAAGAPARGGAARLAVPAIAAAGIVAIAIPFASTASVQKSRDLVRAGDLTGALDEARTAGRIQPYAVTPMIQEAQVLARLGDLEGALVIARDATDDEPGNWRTWLVVGRLESKAKHTVRSVAAYRRAGSLNRRVPTVALAPRRFPRMREALRSERHHPSTSPQR